MVDVENEIAQMYGRFADEQARGSSPSLESWARSVVDDPAVLARLASLPRPKQQPNLVFASLRWHGARPGDAESLREGVMDNWGRLRATILERSTQTNEPARCAVLLPLLHRIRGPIALIEIGAAAGLCLIPDHYSYNYSDGTIVHPHSGPSPVAIDCGITGGTLPLHLRAPDIVWRAGVDLNPLDASTPDTAAWLTTLVWPEHVDRRDRLRAALDVAASTPLRMDRADLRDGLAALLAEVPAGVTPVVQHSATLAYLSGESRHEAAAMIAGSGARWISFERRGVVALTARVPEFRGPNDLFVAALDGLPMATASGHGESMAILNTSTPAP